MGKHEPDRLTPREQALLADTQTARQRLEAVLKSISDGFIALDRDWRCTGLNDRACESMGMSRDEILGRSIWDLYPDTIGTVFDTELRRAAAEQRTAVFEYFYPAQNRWYENRVYPSADGVSIFFVDITERKSAEEEVRRRESLLSAAEHLAHMGSWRWDIHSGRLRWSDELYRVFGLDPRKHSPTHESFIAALHPEDRERISDLIGAACRGEATYDCEFRITRPDGQVRTVHSCGDVIRDPAATPIEAIGMAQDITERTQAEEELRRAKKAAEAANRAKDELLANVSHEIRTPMNAILGMTELALESSLTDDQRLCLETAHWAADSLLRVINDLLDFSKIEAGKLELESAAFSLRGMVDQTQRTLAQLAASKGLGFFLDVQPDVPDILIGDEGRLRQVLFNLVPFSVRDFSSFTRHSVYRAVDVCKMSSS